MNKAFTLIELIIVIVLLGILAATALPRFVDFSSDANASVVKQIAASLDAVNKLVYAQAVLQSMQDTNNGSCDNSNPKGINYNGEFIRTIHGVPWYSCPTNLIDSLIDINTSYLGINKNTVTCSGADFCMTLLNDASLIAPSFSPGEANVIIPNGKKITDNCYAYHVFDRTDNTAFTGYIVSGC